MNLKRCLAKPSLDWIAELHLEACGFQNSDKIYSEDCGFIYTF